MHLLFLKDSQDVSKTLTQTEEELESAFKRYLTLYAEKRIIMQRIIAGASPFGFLGRLTEHLKIELTLIKETKHEEAEVIADLKFLSHDTYLKRTDKILNELHTIQEHDAYVKHVLNELKDVLLNEARKVRRMLAGENTFEIVESLRGHFLIENHLMEKLSIVEGYHDLFEEIYLAEREEKVVLGVKKRFENTLYQQMTRVLVGDDGNVYSTDSKYISELTARIFNKLQDVIMDTVRKGKMIQHPQIDSEFVNSQLFEEFVREELRMDAAKGKIVPRENTISTFVQLFRKLYNSEESPRS